MVRGPQPEDPHRIWEIKVLKRPGEHEVRQQLEQAAAQVQPIMRKRSWRVPLLTEFEPSNPGLLGLNVNGGGGKTSQIKVRVRKPRGGLFPYEHTLGTLLHELVHNVIGAHSASFYAMLDEITKECEDLMAKGIRGGRWGGFNGQSSGRLGGRRPSAGPLRETLLKATEGRAQRQGMLPTGGLRLGGTGQSFKGLTPTQAAAMAAERRAKDNLWCSCGQGVTDPTTEQWPATSEVPGSGRVMVAVAGRATATAAEPRRPSSAGAATAVTPRSQAGGGGTAADLIDLTGELIRPAAEEQRQGGAAGALDCGQSAVIDLTGAEDGGVQISFVSQKDDRQHGSNGLRKKPRRTAEGGKSSVSEEPLGRWPCGTCTLLNGSSSTVCDACGAQRPASAPSGRSSARGQLSTDRMWECPACSTRNELHNTHCCVCHSWRFTTGPPSSVAALPQMSGLT